jgi:hypothetical protein
MSAATLKQRIWLVTAVASALVAFAPATQAATGLEGSPDAIDRYLKNQQAQSGQRVQGNRNATDRYLKNRRAQVGLGFQGSPDAIDRWLERR